METLNTWKLYGIKSYLQNTFAAKAGKTWEVSQDNHPQKIFATEARETRKV